jgi:hypothetical protein
MGATLQGDQDEKGFADDPGQLPSEVYLPCPGRVYGPVRTLYYTARQPIAAGESEVPEMARSTTSVRLEDGLREQLAAAAGAEGTTLTELIERFVREGLACAAHPGIVFKPGPSGRRAALAGGPDVWEIASALRHVTGPEPTRVAAVAEQFGIHERQVAIALNYAAAHREEIASRVQANDRALEEAERVAAERRRLFA